MKRDRKAEVVAQIATQIREADAVFAVDYRGLSVTQAAGLRASLRQADARFRIVKNTLSLRAAEEAGADDLKPVVEDGPTALAFVHGDPALAAKALDTFARQAQILEFKGGLMGDTVLSPDDMRHIARLPGRDQLNAQMAGIVASPLTGLVRGLGSMLSGIAVMELAERIKALEEEFGVSATAVAAAAPAAGGGGGDGAGPAEEQTAFDVVLTGAGDKKIQVIKVVRAATGLGLKEAKALVDEAPKPVKEAVDRDEADKLKGELEEAGASVEVK